MDQRTDLMWQAIVGFVGFFALLALLQVHWLLALALVAQVLVVEAVLAILVALVLSPSTHAQRGAQAVQDLLGGVVRGSLGAAAFGLVVACTAGHLGGLALLVATAVCLATVALVGRVDSLRP